MVKNLTSGDKYVLNELIRFTCLNSFQDMKCFTKLVEWHFNIKYKISGCKLKVFTGPILFVVYERCAKILPYSL